MLSVAPAGAQSLPSLGIPTPGTVPFGSAVRQDGLFLTTPIVVDGVPVLRIAQPVNAPSGELPINMRAQFVQSAITQVLAGAPHDTGTLYDPATLKVTIERDKDQDYLVAKDDDHLTPLPIVTVTSADAQYNHLPIETLASQWQQTLQHALVDALAKRQPAQLKRNYNNVLRAALAAIAVTLLVVVGVAFLRRRAESLEKRVAQHKERLEAEQSKGGGEAGGSGVPRRRFLALSVRAAGPEQRLQQVRALAGSLVWLLVLLWAAGITWALLLFPQTSQYGVIVIRVAARIAFIWIGAALLNRIADLIISRFAEAYRSGDGTSEDRARRVLRGPTISRALGGFKSFIIVFIAALATLSALSIPVASVVTIGGIAALAISFAAQNLVRDLLNGLLVLFEDQYVVGDYVMIGEYNGIVENLTLRVVQIRDSRGHLITIPHSAAIQVVNASRNWSRIDYRVAVDPETDIAKAVGVLRQTLERLRSSSADRDVTLDPVEWIGIEQLSKNGIVLRASLRTAPMRQFELRRRINEAVLTDFRSAGVVLGADPLAPPSPAVNASPDPA